VEKVADDSWYWDLLVAVPYLVGLLTLGQALRNNVGFPLDDSWIHQVIARNLVAFHSWGFTPGVTSSGSSSTLWTLVLAVHYLFFPQHSPVFFPLVLNSVMLIACGVLMWRMARQDGLPLAESLALGMLPGLSGNLDWLAFTGMEHVMFLTLSLLSIALWFRRGTSIAIAVSAGIALGALGITRPEGLALCLGLFAMYRLCGRTLRDVLLAGVTAAVLILPSFLLNLKTSGSLLPMTLRGRLYMYSGKDTLHVGRSSFRGLILNSYKDILAHHFFHTHTGWLVTACVLLSFIGLFALLLRIPNRTSAVCVWAIVDYVAYCVTLPEPGHGGRYQPFVLLLFAPLMAVGLMWLVRLITRWAGAARIGNALAWGSLALFAVVTAMTLPRWKSALHDSIADINSTHVKLARWINQNYPTGTTMAVFDIGAIGYYAHINLVDLGGLVDRNYLPYLVQRRVPDYLRMRGVQYVILPHTGPDTHFGDLLNLLHNPTVRLVPIHTEGANPAIWKNGFEYTGNAFRQQTLYRIEWVPPSEQNPAATERNTRLATEAQEHPAVK
jgi:hypothetical protein